MAVPTFHPIYNEVDAQELYRAEVERQNKNRPDPAIVQVTESASVSSEAASINRKVSDASPYDATSKRRVAMTSVDLCTSYIQSVWPNQNCRLPLRTFVFEILRRSRVQYPVFQVALCYLARCQPYSIRYRREHQGQYPPDFSCGRRILVAASQVASKFLQDRFYSASVWSRVSGLDLKTLQRNELALMQALDWKMFVSSEAYMESCKRLRISIGSGSADQRMTASDSAKVLTPESSPTSLKPVTQPGHLGMSDFENSTSSSPTSTSPSASASSFESSASSSSTPSLSTSTSTTPRASSSRRYLVDLSQQMCTEKAIQAPSPRSAISRNIHDGGIQKRRRQEPNLPRNLDSSLAASGEKSPKVCIWNN